MGRQIQVRFDPADQDAFLEFLRDGSDIEIYRSRSPDISPLRHFPQETGLRCYWIHNLAFPWTPAFQRYEFFDNDSGQTRVFFEPDYSKAPLVEFIPGMRIYWSKTFTAQLSELRYDVEAFDRWFDKICRWVRRTGKLTDFPQGRAWVLPAAYARMGRDA